MRIKSMLFLALIFVLGNVNLKAQDIDPDLALYGGTIDHLETVQTNLSGSGWHFNRTRDEGRDNVIMNFDIDFTGYTKNNGDPISENDIIELEFTLYSPVIGFAREDWDKYKDNYLRNPDGLSKDFRIEDKTKPEKEIERIPASEFKSLVVNKKKKEKDQDKKLKEKMNFQELGVSKTASEDLENFVKGYEFGKAKLNFNKDKGMFETITYEWNGEFPLATPDDPVLYYPPLLSGTTGFSLKYYAEGETEPFQEDKFRSAAPAGDFLTIFADWRYGYYNDGREYPYELQFYIDITREAEVQVYLAETEHDKEIGIGSSRFWPDYFINWEMFLEFLTNDIPQNSDHEVPSNELNYNTLLAYAPYEGEKDIDPETLFTDFEFVKYTKEDPRNPDKAEIVKRATQLRDGTKTPDWDNFFVFTPQPEVETNDSRVPTKYAFRFREPLKEDKGYKFFFFYKSLKHIVKDGDTYRKYGYSWASPYYGTRWEFWFALDNIETHEWNVVTNVEDDEGIKFVASLNEVLDDELVSNPYPNPWNPSTKIEFKNPLDKLITADIRIYNTLGQEVSNLGEYELLPGKIANISVEDIGDKASGVYFARFIINDGENTTAITRELNLVK